MPPYRHSLAFPQGLLAGSDPLAGRAGVNPHLGPNPHQALGLGGRSQHRKSGPSGNGPNCESTPRFDFTLQCGIGGREGAAHAPDVGRLGCCPTRASPPSGIRRPGAIKFRRLRNPLGPFLGYSCSDVARCRTRPSPSRPTKEAIVLLRVANRADRSAHDWRYIVSCPSHATGREAMNGLHEQMRSKPKSPVGPKALRHRDERTCGDARSAEPWKDLAGACRRVLTGNR